MLLDPREDDRKVEDCSGCRADGVRKRLEGEGTEVERKAFERRLISSFPRSSCPGADIRREGVFGCPFGVGDLLELWSVKIARDKKLRWGYGNHT